MTHMIHATPARSATPVADRLVPILWVCLAVFASLAIFRLVAPASAQVGRSASAAGLVSQSGGLTVLTTEAQNEDVLLVLDSRNEELFVYRTELKGGVQLLQRYQVPQLFVDARARSLGGP